MALLTMTIDGVSGNKTKVDITWHYKGQSKMKRYHVSEFLEGMDDAHFEQLEAIAIYRVRQELKNAGTRDMETIKATLEAGSINI